MNATKVRLREVASYYTGKIDIENVNEETYISTTNMLPDFKGVEIASSLPPTIKLNKYEPNDILFSNIRPYFKKIWKSDRTGGCDADILNIRVNSKMILEDFLYYALFRREFFDYIMVGSKGVKMPRGDKEFTLNYEIPLPSIDDQKRIVLKIKPIFEKIESNNHLIFNLEKYSQLLFYKWFVNFNFPNEEGKPYKDSGGVMIEVDGKMIPEGWRIEKLSESSEFINGMAMQKYPPIDENDKLPVIKIKEINNDGFHEGTEFVSKSVDKELIINNGDLLFPWSGSLSVNIWTGGQGALNQHIFKVKSDKYHNWYLYSWLNKHMKYFSQIAYGKKTTMGHINRKHLDYVDNIVPDSRTLERMDKIMISFYDKIVALKEENKNLEEMRDLLIKKLIK